MKKFILLYILIFGILLPPGLRSEDNSVLKRLSPEWGGHLRGRGQMTRQEAETVYDLVGSGDYYDASAEFRLKNTVSFTRSLMLETHYEAVFAGGDTGRKSRELQKRFRGYINAGLPIADIRPINDDRRFLDLTKIISEKDGYALYHRLDRLHLTFRKDRATVSIGRQALTWGNGMLFNPMDMFNPFAPTDIIRDYKAGDDMLLTQFSTDEGGNIQCIYVPRRNPENGDIEWDSSAVAGKFRFSKGNTEFDIMAGRNYRNTVLGIGSIGYLGNAAWRADAVWTFFPEESEKNARVSFVLNMDYSWTWWERNLYGFLEFYYKGLGNRDYAAALSDPELITALERGEIFSLGRRYLGGQISMEIHPLFNFHTGIIINTDDPSAVLQPRFVWSISQNTEAIMGGNIHAGGTGTEYGGFRIPGTGFRVKPGDSAYIWLTCYF